VKKVVTFPTTRKFIAVFTTAYQWTFPVSDESCSKPPKPFKIHYYTDLGHAVAQLVEALRYKPGSIPDVAIGIFH
jgi:hypothetical protein